MHGHEAPNSPSQVFSLSLALPFALTRREKLLEQKEVWGCRGRRRHNKTRVVGGRVQGGEVAERTPFLPQPELWGLPRTHQRLYSNPWAAEPRGGSMGQSGGLLSLDFPTPMKGQCLEMTRKTRCLSPGHWSIRGKGRKSLCYFSHIH